MNPGLCNLEHALFPAVPPSSRPDPTLAAAIRRLRQDRNRTQEDVAHHAGVTVTALARIERSQTNPAWTTVRQIASALGISLVELAHAVESENRRRAT